MKCCNNDCSQGRNCPERLDATDKLIGVLLHAAAIGALLCVTLLVMSVWDVA